ncbi:MAG: NUDIX hydrolase [Candidatus Omnitrophota bacterium]|jgi:ADP-ribose pyrophosphatase
MGRNTVRFQGRLISLTTKKTLLPNGRVVYLDTIRHPGAALVIPLVSENKVVLLKQFRAVINTYLYELPAGTLNKGESPLACAKREIIEETGYAAARLTRVGVIYPVPGYSTEKITIFKAQELKKQKQCCEGDEIIEASVVTKQAVRQLFRAGKITDAKTISAFALCGWL